MAKTENERHRYGQHYTPDVVARLLAAFAIRGRGDLVFDPSCGDGRLLAAARSAKIAHALAATNDGCGHAAASPELAQQPLQIKECDELFGIDRSGEAVSKASQTGGQVAVADFFDVAPGGRVSCGFTLPGEFDAIIGNPPYIRQELLGKYKSRINGLLASALTAHNAPFEQSGSTNTRSNGNAGRLDWHIDFPRWSGRSDIYVYFFAHAAAFLRPGGRLVFLTASSWLDVGYGAQLQEFMLRNFRIILVLESAVESFFADASVNTSITVLEREPDPGRRIRNTVRFIQMLRPLSEIMPASPLETMKLARSMEQESRGRKIGAVRIRTATQQELLRSPREVGDTGRGSPGRKTSERPARQATWGRFLRAEDVFFRVLNKGQERFTRLSDLASVRFGVKTGANGFFYVRPEFTEGGPRAGNFPAVMKPLESLARVRRGITTGANEFFYLKPPPKSENRRSDFPVVAVQNRAGDIIHLESKYLRPVVFSLKEIPAIELRDAGTKMLFFDCPDSREKLRGTRASEYIKAGEGAGIHLRPTCSARVPWYGVARGKEPAPLIFPSKVGERWLVAINQAGVYEDKKLYGIFPGPNVSIALLAALLNSTWARYYAEMTCRQLTGAQAIADIDVAVAGQILIPDPQAIEVDQRRQLRAAVGALARRPVLSIFEEVGREDRRLLDELVLTAIGFTDNRERRRVLSELYRASTELVRLRLARSRKCISVDKCAMPALESAAKENIE